MLLTFALLSGGFPVCLGSRFGPLQLRLLYNRGVGFDNFHDPRNLQFPGKDLEEMIGGNYVIQHLRCLPDRFYLLGYPSSTAREDGWFLVKFLFVYRNRPTSVVLNRSHFWCCLLNRSVYRHNLYSKEYSILFKPLSTLEVCLLLLSVSLLSSQVGIHNTKPAKLLSKMS